MKGSLNTQIAQLQERIAELSELLLDTKSPDFHNRASERNHLSVKLEVLKQQHEGRWQPEFDCPVFTVNKQQ